MSFIKDLGSKLGSAANDAAEKAKEAAEVAKLKMDISGEEKKISQALVELGKIYFEANKDSDEAVGKDFIEKIVVAEDAIKALEEKIAVVKC